MKTRKRYFILVQILINTYFFPNHSIFSQGVKPLLISQNIGFSIDQEEKIKYKLLTFIKSEEFDSALFYPADSGNIKMLAWLNSQQIIEKLYSEEDFKRIRNASSSAYDYHLNQEKKLMQTRNKEDFFTGPVFLLGIGYPEGFQADIRYPLKPFQIAFGVGNTTYFWADGYSLHFELIFNFAGSSEFSYLRPWYARIGFYFNRWEYAEEEYNPSFYLLNFGREFNLSKRMGFSLDAGLNAGEFFFFGSSLKFYYRVF